jgi:fructoselysine-6-P-deglycase FrlB-like protein
MTHYSEELATQPAVWLEAIERGAEFAARLPADGARVAVLGCGTSWFMAQALATAREAAGKGQTEAFAASEVPPGRTWDLVIALSRSGTTTELIRAVEALPAGTPTLVVTAETGTPLGAVATEEIVLDFANEKSVVQTRFATTAISVFLNAYGWDVTASAKQAEGYLDDTLPAWAGDIKQFVFLGQGIGAALANEAALKFREILRTWSESYPTMEFRHGPISALTERSLVWVLDGGEPSIDTQVEETGARLFRSEGDPLAELVRIHRFAEGLADLRGINPDAPPYLTRSVVLPSDR